MRRSRVGFLSAAGLVGFGEGAGATDLRVGLGVPVPVAIYGYLPADGAGGGSGDSRAGLDFLGALSLEASFALSPARDLGLGVWADGALITGSDGDTTAQLYLASGGLAVSWSPALSTTIDLHTSLGVGVLASGIHVDAAMVLDTWSLALRAAAALTWELAPGLSLGPSAAFLAAGPPLDATHWYGRTLNGTRYLQLSITTHLTF